MTKRVVAPTFEAASPVLKASGDLLADENLNKNSRGPRGPGHGARIATRRIIMNTPKPDQIGKSSTDGPGPSHEEIARRAYQLWEERGNPAGSHEEDWYRAEHELRHPSDAAGDTPAATAETSE